MAEVNINDLKPNSHQYHEETAAREERRVEKVVQGTATKKKKSLARRFVDIFLSEDVSDVKTYIIYDVVVPAIKENVADVINSAVGMLFFGETRRRRSGRSQSTGGVTKVNYGGYFNGGSQSERMPTYRHSNVPSRVDDLTVETRGDAELVLDQMMEILDQYDQVTVSDYYDLMGVSTSFTDNKYGWKDLRNARVVRAGRDGYRIELPREIVLER